MVILKCKMCGGDLQITEGMSVVNCEYCGTQQTVPNVDDEKKVTLFERANRLRMNNEFDKAAGVYETIVADFPTEAEAYWGLVLCRYGIEYVDDPASGKKIPTCHRSSFASIMDDKDFDQACENADVVARKLYREEAKVIEEIRKGIIEVSGKEEPYDIFICYKETDATGDRTIDSVLAQDVYDALNEKGYRVFFSRVTLEDKLGQEYEPYIFAALNSAKIMLAFGTDYEYYNAAWVRNEWSRYLQLMNQDKSKHLIPCYKDIDAYDLPKEFAKLQAQDMGKVGAVQDLVRGIEKLLPLKKDGETSTETVKEIVKETVVVQQNGKTQELEALLKRGKLFLKDGDWDSAKEYFNRVLDIDPDCADAYVGLLCAEKKAVDSSKLPRAIVSNMTVFAINRWKNDLENDRNFKHAMRCADEKTKAELQECVEKVKECMYETACMEMKHGKVIRAQTYFIAIQGYRDVDAKLIEIEEYKAKKQQEEQEEAERKKAEQERKELEEMKEKKYKTAVTLFNEKEYKNALELFQSEHIADYKNSAELADKCIVFLEKKEEDKKLFTGMFGIVGCFVLLLAITYALMTQVIMPSSQYNKADDLFAAGQYEEAAVAFEKLGDYKDAPERVEECNEAQLERENAVAYQQAENMLKKGDYEEAIVAFGALDDYRDATERVAETYYEYAEKMLESENAYKAATLFGKAAGYKDAKARSFNYWNNVAIRETISAYYGHTVGLKNDGSVVAVGNNADGQCNVDDWKDIEAISLGINHTVGLKSNGSVVAVGDNDYGQCNVDDWESIVAISASSGNTVGLKADGSVVAVGYNADGQCNVDDWENIIAISASDRNTIGLKSDGTVVAIGFNNIGQCDVSDWVDILMISTGGFHTVGLKADGTVVATGNNTHGQCNVVDWTDIVAISVGKDYTVGLKANGTVVAVGNNEYGQCNTDIMDDWSNIVAISAGCYYIVGLKSDGTVVASGDNDYGQCNVADWTGIKLPRK